jgi:hypothetical protein
MNFVEQLTAVALLVDFFLGVTFGVVFGAAYGSVRDERRRTLLVAPPDPLSAGARMLHGVYASSDEHMRSLLTRGGEATADERGTDTAATEGQEGEK